MDFGESRPLPIQNDLFNDDYKRAEQAKLEFESVRQAREAAFLRAHRELETLRMQQQVDLAAMEAKVRDTTQLIERIEAKQGGTEHHLNRIRAEREEARDREERSANQLNQRLMDLENAKENTRQAELDNIRAKMRETTETQSKISTGRVELANSKSGARTLRGTAEAELDRKEHELDAREKQLNKEWEDIEARRINLEGTHTPSGSITPSGLTPSTGVRGGR